MIDDPRTPKDAADARAELEAALSACAVADRSDLGRLVGTGPDLLGLIQRLGTGDVAGLEPGSGASTVLTTNKGRIVEPLFVTHLGDDGVLLVGRPGAAVPVLEHLQRYTFAEKTGLADTGAETGLLAVFGPRAAEALAEAGLPRPRPLGCAEGELDGTAVRVLGHDGSDGDGFALLVPAASRETALLALTRAATGIGGRAVGPATVEVRRVLLGRPGDAELTDEYNPLEAGLWDAVSFDKGCYVGQEVVARLRTYDKVSRQLWGLALPDGAAVVAAGTELFAGGRAVGRITSCVAPPGAGHPVALGYVKHRHVEDDGAPLSVGSADAVVTARRVELPMVGEDDP